MAPRTVALVVLSAVLHALWNAAIKREADPRRTTVAVLVVSALTAALAVPFAPGRAFPAASGALWSLAAGLCEGGYFLTLGLALARAPLGVAYTILRGGSILLVWPVSIVWLGETATAPGLAGALLLTVGLAAVGLERRGIDAKGVGISVLCAAFVAGYHLCYKRALEPGSQPAAVFATALAIAAPLNVLSLGRGALGPLLRAVRSRPLVPVAAGVVCTASFLVFLVALADAGAGAVLTLRNTSVVFAQVLSWGIGEPPQPLRVGGALLVGAGAVLLGLPP